MESSPSAGAICSECHAPLSAHGYCLSCLLRGGLSDDATAAESAVLAAAPTVSLEGAAYGDFEITRRTDGTLWELGRGAMGVTYRAVDRQLHRAVALKVIQLPGQAAGSDGAGAAALRERFLREARAAAALQHPNVAGIYQFGAAPRSGRCYYAMELVEGETLDARVRRDGPLDVGTAREIATQVVAALVEAAGRGLIHRDLKPSNLMLEGGGMAGRLKVKVIDFGLAKAAAAPGETDLTHGGFVGTPAYASPEQFARGPVDARTDIYSLGVTLWFALTGQAPFGGKTLDELRHHPARDALPVEQLKARKVPPALVTLLCAMLAADPARRPGSARELATALEAARPAGSRPGPPSGEGRHLTSAAVFALCAALGIALCGGAAWWLTRSQPASPVAAPPVASAPADPAVPEKSVAVLPFDNLSADKDSAVFADGVQDEVLTNLAKIADLKVISRTSVMQYKGAKQFNLHTVSQTLGVAYVVEGSVQRAGDKIRVNVQLIDARTDAHRWAEKYDRPLNDIFAIQSDIAQAIAGQLQAVISPQEHAAMTELPTRDATAYELYLRARAAWDDYDEFPTGRESSRVALDLLRRATARDPQFVRAFTLMTLVQGNVFRNIERTAANAATAREFAETVVRLRPGSVEADMAMGVLHYMVEFDFAHAREDFAAVLRRLPNDAVAQQFLAKSLRRQGRLEEALTATRRALELDPESNASFFFYLEVLEGLRRYVEINHEVDRRLALYPRSESLRVFKARVLVVHWADPRAARAELARLPAGFDPDGVPTYLRLQCGAMERDYDAMTRDLAARPGFVYYGLQSDEQYTGDIARYRGETAAAATAYEAARQRLEAVVRAQPGSDNMLFTLALVDAYLGRRDEALAAGRRALAICPPDDMRDWPESMTTWARVLAQTGEREEAIRTLQAVAARPYGPEYGPLRLHPDWDPLRGDPRFEAIVASLAPDPPAGTAGPAAPSPAAVPEKSVAVLPFDNLSADKDSAVFADGVQDEVLTDLAHVADLKVISRSSVLQYKEARQRNLREIGQTLGVAYVVEGSVQRAGGKIKVAAQLIDARTDAHRWADQYVRNLDDVFAIQSELAQAIAGQLQAAISPQEHAAMTQAPTHDLPAYAAYLRAREFWSSFDVQDQALFRRTVELAKEATDRDPGFARAYAFAGYVQCLTYRLFDASPAQAAVVHDLTQTVARLRPGSGEAHLAEGQYRFFVTHEFTRACDEAAAAVRLLPNDAGALYLLGTTEVSLERWEPALTHLRKAAELDPDDGDTMNEYAALLVGVGRQAEALAVLDRWIGAHQTSLWPHAYKSEVLLTWKGDLPAARAELALLPPNYDPQGVVTAQRLLCDVCARDFAAADRDLAACQNEEIYGVPRAFFQGCVARYRGDAPAAAAAFARARPVLAAAARTGPESGRSLLYLATVDAALGRKEEALRERTAGLDKKLPEHNTEGPRMALLGARVLAWAGATDEAFGTLQTIVDTPASPGYGALRLDPAWDPLRDDPRFGRLVATLTPKP